MIDIHTHIIPALDDGPPDMDTSVGMGRVAAGEGITDIIATSHSAEAMEVGHEGMEARLQEVRDAWLAAGLSVNVHLGVEIYLRPDTPGHLKSGRLWPLAGSRYLLVEVDYRPWPTYADDALFTLQLLGYIPILAHPERYTAIQTDPNRMYTLAERGILSQVTAAALLGEHGSEARRCAETLVRHGLAQFISSDSHGITTRKRSPKLLSARRLVEEQLGEEAARALVLDNPSYILSDTHFEPSPERVAARKWSLGGFFGRD